MKIKSTIYKALKYSNDINAVRKNRVPRRIGRRVYGRLSGKLAARIFG